ncbi:MAG: hypothetical protein LW628_03085, partial [Fimbriimonadaceae bacterium]|nr:hypothetical protein [Fimbriimonadaceae bacterium]
AVGLFLWLRSSIRGTEMGEAFSSFFRQSGIIPILFFMLFYRFAEAMVAKMSVLFLKGDHSMGGASPRQYRYRTCQGSHRSRRNHLRWDYRWHLGKSPGT